MSVAIGAARAEPAASGTVRTVTGAEAEAVILSGEPTVVEAVALWCPHCAKLEPDFEQAARVTRSAHYLRVVMSQEHGDGGVEPAFKEAHGVGGFPTILACSGGACEAYDGPRTPEALAALGRSL
jgi:thiol-disulfide isomerase/thioredoxin